MLSKEYEKKLLGEFLFRTNGILNKQNGDLIKILESYGKKRLKLIKITYYPNINNTFIFINSIFCDINSFEKKHNELLYLSKLYEKKDRIAQKTLGEIILEEVHKIKGNYRKRLSNLLKIYKDFKIDLMMIENYNEYVINTEIINEIYD